MGQSDEDRGHLYDLARELHAFEALLRQTIAAGGRLTTAAAEAQAAQNLSVTAGHAIYKHFAEANFTISTAIEQTAGGHRLLEALARSVGIDVQAYGEGEKPPRSMPWTGAVDLTPAVAG